MKSRWLIILLAGLIACGRALESPPTPTLIPTDTPLPTVTPTPTPMGGGAPTPAPSPEMAGYALEFTNLVSSGAATLHAAAHTCSGIHSAWQGNFDLELDFERMHISGAGPFDFTLPAGENYVEGEAPFTGGGAVSATSCVILGVSDPLRFEITFSEDERSASVIMGSIGGGLISIQCPDSPTVTIPFAVAWGPEPLEVPITAYDGCP